MEKVEQTYKLPEGWILVKLEDISKQITDGSHNPPKSVDSGIPMLSAQNIENGKITFDAVRYITNEDFEYENQRTKIEEGDVLLTIVATIGRTAVVSKNIKSAFTLQRSVAAIKPLIISEFLMYCFQSPLFQKQLTENAKGTAQKGVYLKTLRSLEIPLAPLQEQHRIVSKIETLFSELDQAEKSLRKAKQQLKVYKQALLKSAFNGTLTKDWRKENNLEPIDNLLTRIKEERIKQHKQELIDWQKIVKQWEQEGKKPRKPKKLIQLEDSNSVEKEKLYDIPLDYWKWIKIGNISNKITDGEHLRPQTESSGVFFLSAKDVLEDGVSFENPLFISEETARKSRERCNPEYGDLLMVSRGATVGRTCMVNTKELFCLLGSVILIKVDNYINSKFVTYFLKSTYAQNLLIGMSGATAQQAIYLRDIQHIPIPIPNRSEQDSIVSAIENKLSLLDKLKQIIDSSLKHSDILRHSILRQAFMGKLAEQYPKEEDAFNLIIRLKEEKENYLMKQIEIKQNAPKKIKKMSKSLSIEDVLKSSVEPMPAKKVWQESKHNEDIAAFYAELKELGDKVIEIRKGLDSFLSLK